MRIYLDCAATTPVDPRVRAAMEPFWTDRFGNPSSAHRFGREALDAVNRSRQSVARLLGAKTSEIVFTGSGTESDNAAIKGIALALRNKGDHIITSAMEHHAVLHACEFLQSQGFRLTVLPVDGNGLVDPDAVKRAITRRTILISIMHANNEVGTVQPISRIGAIARERGVLFHTDAVQTAGHIPIDIEAMSVDLLSVSAHKLYGPKGVGALAIRENTPFIPLLHGGGHEGGKRSSTHNVPGIVGLGKASEIALEEMNEESARILGLRNKFALSLSVRIPGIRMNGHPEHRLPNNLHVSIDGVEGEALLMHCDSEGLAVSSGSACSSGSGEPSHVLLAMGLTPEQSRGSLRLTLGRYTTEQEIEVAADVLDRVVRSLRSLSAFGKEA